MSVVIVAAAVIVRDGKVLITQRMKFAELGTLWEFPGGKVEPGESPKDAVARECLEECGIDVEATEIFEVVFHRYPKRDVLLLFYRARLLKDEQAVQHLGVADHMWCLPSELDAMPFPPADTPVIEKLKKQNSG